MALKVAVCKLGIYDLFILAPIQGTVFTRAAVVYKMEEKSALHGSQMHDAVG